MRDDLADDALIAELKSRVEGSRIGDRDDYLGLIAEAGRRRLAAAAPLLETILRRGAVHERDHPSEFRDVRAALRALTALRDPRAVAFVHLNLAFIPEVVGFSPAGIVVALDYLRAVDRAVALERARPFLAAADRRLRGAAARVLGEIGRGEAADDLVAVLDDPAPEVALAAALALARLGDARGRPLLLRDVVRAPTAALVDALGSVGKPDDAVVIARHGDHADASIRCAVVDALAEIDLQRFRKRIERFLDDADESVRAAARDALEDGA